MLGSSETLAKMVDSVARYTAGSGLKVRMAESNPVFGGGQSGISDTMGRRFGEKMLCLRWPKLAGSALTFTGRCWLLYSIAQTSSGAFEPRPLYYAMLLFTYAGRGSLVPINKQVYHDGCERSPYEALVANAASILFNRNFSQNEHVRIETRGQNATIPRLTAPSVESKSGLTFGGASVSAKR